MWTWILFQEKKILVFFFAAFILWDSDFHVSIESIGYFGHIFPNISWPFACFTTNVRHIGNVCNWDFQSYIHTHTFNLNAFQWKESENGEKMYTNQFDQQHPPNNINRQHQFWPIFWCCRTLLKMNWKQTI